MPNFAQIKCISKSPRHNPWERITHVGGYTNERWKITLDNAIEHIESGKWKFYVEVNGDRVDVIVATSANGNKYLKTVPDGDQPNNNLLSVHSVFCNNVTKGVPIGAPYCVRTLCRGDCIAI